MMGLELQSWQQAFLDVATELVEDEDGVLVPAYDTVQLSVGRRAGKTLALLVLMLTKMRTLPRHAATGRHKTNRQLRSRCVTSWCHC